MMQLDSYISDLLYRYDCVTVPDFGAFLSRKISATINDESHTLYPPKKQLSFNEQLQSNDGLLANYIAETEKVPYDVALKKINKHVRSIKSFLVEGETIAFKNIGDILLNSEGKMIFEPSYNINYLTDAFGLSEFKQGVVQREVYKKEAEELEKVIPIAVTPERRKTIPYLKYAAVALIALMLGGVGASSYYSNQIEQQNQIAQEEATEQLDSKIQEATFVIENPLPSIALKVDKQSGNYHIIAGAFRVEENAKKKVKQLREAGFKSRNLGANKYGLHEVVYSSHEDRLEALRELRSVKRSHNSDAWLMVKELEK